MSGPVNIVKTIQDTFLISENNNLFILKGLKCVPAHKFYLTIRTADNGESAKLIKHYKLV
jgi:hypothetical protein